MDNILVVGAGPTGLAFTLALLQRGVSVRLIDEKEGPSIHSKAFGIHARTLEIFAKMGVISAFLEKGVKTHGITFHKDGKQRVLELTHLQDTPYPFILMLPQSETEKILIEEITKLGGKIEWKTKLVGLTENEARLSNGTHISYDWLIGCDGGRSAVRHFLHLPFEGVDLSETFLIVDLQGKIQARNSSPHFFFSKQGLVGIIALNPSLTRLIFPLKGDEIIENNPIALKKVLEERGCRDFLIPEKVI